MPSPILVEIRASSADFMAKMGEARAEMGKLGTSGSANFKKMAAVGKAAFEGIAAGAVAIGAVSIDMADKFEAAQTRLQGAITNTGGSFDAYKAQIAETTRHLADFGFNSATVEDAMAPLVTATHSTKTALGEMGLAADIAKGRNMTLSDATGLLVKVQTGHVALLGRLGIATKDASGKTITQKEALAELAKMYGGDAARAATTFGGKVDATKAQLDNLTAQIGVKLEPILEKLALDVENVVTWFQKHTTAAKVLAVAIGTVLVAAIGAYVVEMAAAAVETIAATWPILAIIAAVAAVGVGIYELATHWSTVWNWIKQIVGDAVTFIKSHLTLILTVALGPVGLAIAELGKHWSTIWGAIKGAVQDAWNIIRPILSTMASTLKTVTGAVGDVTHAVSKVPGAGVLSHLVPHLAQGGIVKATPGGTLALIGEAGIDEAVVPLGGSVTPLPKGSGVGGDIYVPVQIVIDGKVISDTVTKYQRQQARRGVPVAAG